MKKYLIASITAITLAVGISGCGTSVDKSPGSSNAPSKPSGPNRTDGKALADWTAVRMAAGNTGEVCKVATGVALKAFNNKGWCQQPPALPVKGQTVQLRGTCSPYDNKSTKETGDLYTYKVTPSVIFDPDKGKTSQITVVVHKDGSQFAVVEVDVSPLIDSDSTKDPYLVIGGGCPGTGGASPTTGPSIPVK